MKTTTKRESSPHLKLLRALRHTTDEGSYGLLVQGVDKIYAREMEKLGLVRFVDYYHGDQYWLAC